MISWSCFSIGNQSTDFYKLYIWYRK